MGQLRSNALYFHRSETLDLGSDIDFPTVEGGDTPIGLWVETGGDVRVGYVDGSDDTFAVPDNFVLPAIVTKVYSTANGTTATGVHALY